MKLILDFFLKVVKVSLFVFLAWKNCIGFYEWIILLWAIFLVVLIVIFENANEKHFYDENTQNQCWFFFLSWWVTLILSLDND